MLTQSKRPFDFDQMIGQKGIISEMKKRSKTMDFPEIQIYSGNSGTGKTTLAYIIASLLNDPNPILKRDGTKSPNPESASSISIREEKFNRDTKLYDASSMSKDDVIQLGKSLANAPMYDKNKIIIIDEAQELSKAGKGVVLELLEKKRKGTYIIMCTMAIETFDKAVRSRGHVYNFRSPSSSEIAEYLFSLTEGIAFPEIPEIEEFFSKGIFLIAENCEGSVRMAVQNFERCLYGEFWTAKQIEQEFSFISEEKLSELVLKVASSDSSCIPEIKTFGAKEFYYKALKTYNTAYLYHCTGYIDQEWKKGLAEQLRDKNLSELLEKLLKVDEGPYFKEDLFFYYLATIMKKNKKEASVQKPIRRVIT